MNEIDLEQEKALKKKKKLRRRLKARRFWDRLAGFIIVTVLAVGCGLLGLEWVILKGPSPALRDLFISTMDETRRFRFVPQIFMTADELNAIRTHKKMETDIATDKNLITVAANQERTVTQIGSASGTGADSDSDPYGLVDEDGDGIIFTEVKGNGYLGYMTVILDPKRVFVGMPDSYGGVGLTLEQMCQKYGAIGGINAGGFKDDGGGGLGGMPEGLTIVDGVCFNQNSDVSDGFVGFTYRQVTIFFTVYVFFQVWNQINCRSLTPNQSGLAGLSQNRVFLLISSRILPVLKNHPTAIVSRIPINTRLILFA